MARCARRAFLWPASVPGVEAVGVANTVPFVDRTTNAGELTLVDNGEKKRFRLSTNAVTGGYFAAMGIPLLQREVFDGSQADAVIVNQAFVKAYLGKRQAVGTVFCLYGEDARRIVGVARGTKNMTLGEGDEPQLYEPLAQSLKKRTRVQFVLKTSAPPTTQVNAIREALRQVDPAVGIEVSTLFSAIGFAFLPSQLGAGLMGGIAILGLLLAAIGLYGILAFTIAKRTREIGIRLALGASRVEIGTMVLRETAVLVALVLGTTALLATIAPLRRAIRIDASQCLRLD